MAVHGMTQDRRAQGLSADKATPVSARAFLEPRPNTDVFGVCELVPIRADF